MADRGRDLKFSILSDVGQFDTDKPARGLEDLSDAAEAAGKSVDRLSDIVDRSRLDDVQRDARDGADGLDEFERSARQTADRVDTAFDAIAKSARTNLRQKLDDDTDKAKRSLHEVRDEANDTAREMGASFGGTTDDLVDGLQELAANAGQAFGPLGLAAASAAAVGVGLIRAEQEKLKTLTNDLVSEMLEAGGKLTDAAIDSRVQNMATEDAAAFVKLQETADRLGLSFRDLARAKAGDGEAAQRLLAHVAELQTGISKQAAASGTATGAMYEQQTALGQVAKELQTTATAYNIAREATSAVTSATGGAADGYRDVQRAAAAARGEIQKPVKVPDIVIKADYSNVTRATRLAWLEADAYFRHNPITIRTKGPTGARPIRDVP